MIHVDLITPEKLAFSDTVEFIAAPTTLGEIGVLPHHAPLLTQLAPGELRFRKDGVTRFVAISGGFLEVQKGSRVSIFAETAEFADEIDVERARLAAERAKTQLASADLTGKVADIRRRRTSAAPAGH
jgi:F-type H+-transporting ATPase subunit epsilon